MAALPPVEKREYSRRGKGGRRWIIMAQAKQATSSKETIFGGRKREERSG